jgi:transposase
VPFFVGIDLHKRVIEAVILDHSGTIVQRARFECTREAIEQFAHRRLGPEHEVVLEATTHSWAVVDLLEPHCARVVVSNPLRTRAIAEAKIKTDRVDALVLAQLLRCAYLPTVWQPDAETRLRRRRCAYRAALVSDRTRLKNRIHAILHQRLIPVPVGDLFCKQGMQWLAALELDAQGHSERNESLRALALVEEQIETVSQTLTVDAAHQSDVRLLMTLPGVSVAVAQTLLGALGDISRFRSADRAASYLGLVPSTRQSADRCFHGPITKQGRGHARWMLIQAAQHVLRHPGPLGVFFRRVKQRKTHNVAVVATARKLVVIAWHMLKKQEPYRYALPAPTEAKLARVRLAAGGLRRKSGNRKGTPRSPSYGSGQRTRRVPALGEVYSHEGLPDLRTLAPGEQAMLEAEQLTGFAARIREPQRVRRADSAHSVAAAGEQAHPRSDAHERRRPSTRG